jgi:MFS family permease
METNSFLKKLFDLEMKESITLGIIKTLYTIGIAIAGIVGVAFVVTAFRQNFAMGLVYVIAAPIAFLLLVVVLRVVLELLMTLFKIEENTRKIDMAVEAEVTEAVEAEASQEQTTSE